MCCAPQRHRESRAACRCLSHVTRFAEDERLLTVACDAADTLLSSAYVMVIMMLLMMMMMLLVMMMMMLKPNY